jgi:hypothetical protein
MGAVVRAALVAMAGALMLTAAPARAAIELKAGCDGKWVAKPEAGVDGSYTCERTASIPLPPVRAHRATVLHRRIAHLRPIHRPRPVIASPAVQLAAATMRSEQECVALSCPQFLLTGVGY